ncbi:MAG TPA: flagellar assembly protein FliW [candidate division Zixibacteria bacterium]|nr:flagellar assembly protein FliW [candidate division Zixibacteria bacterium]
MIVQSLRLGDIEVSEDKLITMERPVLGFEKYKKYCLIEIEELKPFLWFQSIDEPAISFLVVNPRLFMTNYKIEINSKEIAELKIDDVNAVETYVVVTLAETPEDITANMQGPILINTENNLGKQLVLVNTDFDVKYYFMRYLPKQENVSEQETASSAV